MTAGMARAGKCSNFGNCSLADARTTQEIPAGTDFACSECGKPLLMLAATEPAKNRTALVVVAVAVVGLVVAGGFIAWSLTKGKAKEPPAVVAPAPAPAAPPQPQPTPAPASPPPEAAAPAPLPPESGNCSDADAKAGLCRQKN